MSKDIYEEIVELRAKGHRAALATIIAKKGATPRKEAAKMLVYEDGRQTGSIVGGSTEASVCREALSVIKTGIPKLLSLALSNVDPEESALVCGGFMEVYVEPVLPDPTLFIFGAGHVSKAIADVAGLIGFRIAVIDDRAKYANSTRFPQVGAFHIGPWEEVLGKLAVNNSSYLFIATREHQFDLICLRFAVQSSAKYIGMLGSRKKTRMLFDTLEKEGIDRASLERVYVPVGIDIGSETPEEIAVSIAAEMIAVRKNVDIRSMKNAWQNLKSSANPAGKQEATVSSP
jgi:xanthine dehydrogenase accessory factor